MQLEVIKQKELPLLSRTRVSFWDNEKGPTPPRLQLKDEVAKMLKTSPEQVVIRHVYPQYGKNKTKIIVHVYKDLEKMKLFEHKNTIGKHVKKEKSE